MLFLSIRKLSCSPDEGKGKYLGFSGGTRVIPVQYQQPGGSCRVGGAGVLRGSWTEAPVGKLRRRRQVQ